MVSPVVIWICMALAGSTLVVQHFVRPRLPVYKLTIQNIPMLSRIQGQLKMRLRTAVQLHNKNYMHIDVHALSFDVFYPDWNEESLAFIGRVQDRQQQQEVAVVGVIPPTEPPQQSPSKASKTRNKSAAKQPLWQIHPRADFSVTDDIYMAPAFQQMLYSLPGIVRGMWRDGGTSLIVPTTGVAHIKASSTRAPFTVSFVCDNLLNAWSMSVTGFECSLFNLQPGWVHLEHAIHAVNEHVTKLPLAPTGAVLPHVPESASRTMWRRQVNQMAWEEAMQII